MKLWHSRMPAAIAIIGVCYSGTELLLRLGVKRIYSPQGGVAVQQFVSYSGTSIYIVGALLFLILSALLYRLAKTESTHPGKKRTERITKASIEFLLLVSMVVEGYLACVQRFLAKELVCLLSWGPGHAHGDFNGIFDILSRHDHL